MPRTNLHPDYVTEEEMKKAAAKCEDMDTAMLIRLLFYSGARVSEILLLTPRDIDFEKGVLKLRALKRKDLAWKLVPVPTIRDELQAFCSGKRYDKPLFNISRQVAYNHIRQAFLRIGIRNVYPHLLRDSLATNWVLRGGDIHRLSRMLGHKSIKMTQDRYLKYSSDDIREEAEKVFHST
ncbi:site-specific integrase [Dehalococcoidia bacterium]|nr:site-specific integrase [Dehalococcoidia bacterium]